MYVCDLIRGTVLGAAAAASVLGAVAILVAGSDDDRLTLLVCSIWWPLALVAGLMLGRPRRAADAMRPLLAKSRTNTELPTDRPDRATLA
ncbi:MAG: hypothetical protein ACKOPI_01650 [bacterium]